jgi:superfamily II DNA or RNA helicase
MPASLQTLLPLDLPPNPADTWIEALSASLGDPNRHSGFLAQAEAAVEACPGDGAILELAATSALLDKRPDRALVFLKRFSKRYKMRRTEHLLHALALFQVNKTVTARVLLEHHKLTEWDKAFQVFPARQARYRWLVEQLDAIMGRGNPFLRRQRLAKPPRKERKAKPARPSRPADPARRAAPAGMASASAPLPPPLPQIAIDIPFRVELDLAPLLSATTHRPEQDGRWWGLRERFAHLGLAQGFDELLCLPHLVGVEPLWHQIETVRKVLKQFHGRVLLADEVGLGKTIEAGMVLKEYLLRGMAERMLVLVPAALVGQWREELETKFGLACATTQDASLRDDADVFWNQKRIIASISSARRQEHAGRLLAHNFDLVIVDEAHHLRDRSSQSWKLVDALNKRFLLLLSATPVQNDLVELYNLLTLLKPGIFKTQKEFRTAYMTPGHPRRPANPGRLRELMRGAMIRNTRAVVALKLPRRHALTLKVDGAPDEAAAYADLAGAVRRFATERAAPRHGLALQHLLTAAGSSPHAAAGALARFAARHPDDTAWPALAERWALIRTGAKEAALLDLLRRNPAEKKLVFVHSRATLARLAELLAQNGFDFARFDGSLSGPEKDCAIVEFRERVPVLLCTESGGEGRNIQFCNTLINFDVPWNPMAIEQRIGRIDRIGQSREVFIFNLVTRGTLEEQVLLLLDEKISMFELVVGEVGAILGGLDEERDFSNLVLDAWLNATEIGRAEAFDALGRQLEQARAQHEGAKALDEALFGQDFETA